MSLSVPTPTITITGVDFVFENMTQQSKKNMISHISTKIYNHYTIAQRAHFEFAVNEARQDFLKRYPLKTQPRNMTFYIKNTFTHDQRSSAPSRINCASDMVSKISKLVDKQFAAPLKTYTIQGLPNAIPKPYTHLIRCTPSVDPRISNQPPEKSNTPPLDPQNRNKSKNPGRRPQQQAATRNVRDNSNKKKPYPRKSPYSAKKNNNNGKRKKVTPRVGT